MEINTVNQVLVRADDINLCGKNINTIKNNEEITSQARKEICLELDTLIDKHKFIVRHETKICTHCSRNCKQ
jgi:hypothetical protein